MKSCRKGMSKGDGWKEGKGDGGTGKRNRKGVRYVTALLFLKDLSKAHTI